MKRKEKRNIHIRKKMKLIIENRTYKRDYIRKNYICVQQPSELIFS